MPTELSNFPSYTKIENYLHWSFWKEKKHSYAKQDEESFVGKLKISEKHLNLWGRILLEAREKWEKKDFTGTQSNFHKQLRDNTENDEENPENHHISKFLQLFDNANKNELWNIYHNGHLIQRYYW